MSLKTIRRTRRFSHPREMVWRALTDSEALSAWLMPNDFRAEIGHRFTFRTDPAPGFDGTVHAEVLALDEPSLWRVSWRGGGLDTILEIRLEEVPGGTRLQLEHSGFRTRDIVPRVILGMGWSRLLKTKLDHHLQEGPGIE